MQAAHFEWVKSAWYTRNSLGKSVQWGTKCAHKSQGSLFLNNMKSAFFFFLEGSLPNTCQMGMASLNHLLQQTISRHTAAGTRSGLLQSHGSPSLSGISLAAPFLLLLGNTCCFTPCHPASQVSERRFLNPSSSCGAKDTSWVTSHLKPASCCCWQL